MNFKFTIVLAISGSIFCCNTIAGKGILRILPVNEKFGEQGVAWEKFSISSLSQIEEENKFILFINDGMLNIKCNKPGELLNGEVIIYNLLGQEMLRKRLETSILNQVVLPLQNTCYIVKIHYSGNVFTQKIIVNS